MYLATIVVTFTTSNPVISCFNLFQILQLIHDPTRVSEFTNSTIDLIFTSHPELVSESGVIPVLISDHYLVYGVHCWKGPKKEGRSIKFRCFKDIDNDDFRDDLLNAPWEHVLNCQDVNDAWSIWHSTFMSIINHRAPMKSKRIRGNALPWLDEEIIQLMRQRDRAHKIAKRSGSQNNWDGPGFESHCGKPFASELWQFRLPRFASVFRRRH